MKKIVAAALGMALCLLSLPSRAGMSDLPSLELRLREDVSFLSDSLREGRGSGSRGIQDAAFYICGRMRAEGLRTKVQSFEAGGNVCHNLIGEFRGDHGSSVWTLVCAYYDGKGMPGSRLLGGADANASGVAAMLALIPGLKRSGKNILFVALDAHNTDLAGARALMSLNYKIGQVINMDTLGSILAPPQKFYKHYLIVLGATQRQRTSLISLNGTPCFGAAPAEEGKPCLSLHFDYYGSARFTDMFYRKISDQAPFVDAGIPSVMFTSGITMRTNKESDDADSLDYPVFARRVELIRQWIISL